MTNTSNGWIEFRNRHMDFCYIRVLFPDFFYQAVSNMLKEPRALAHHLYGNTIELLIVDGTAQAIVLGSFFKIGMDGNIKCILVADLLFFVVVAVVRKKLQPFE